MFFLDTPACFVKMNAWALKRGNAHAFIFMPLENQTAAVAQGRRTVEPGFLSWNPNPQQLFGERGQPAPRASPSLIIRALSPSFHFAPARQALLSSLVQNLSKI
jgi:hypothetical protein